MATERQSDSTDLYHQLDTYRWDQDEEFQGGLRAILGSVQDPQQVDHLTLRAKCYYYARKAGTPVDFDGYKNWVEARRGGGGSTNGVESAGHAWSSEAATPNTESSGGMGDAPKPASFAEICDMIAEGKSIPGIKDIPDTILEGHASESQAERRKKPWEREEVAAAEDKPSWMT
ncbi:Hypothetical predicted protein [Lecanosticta acicola]|uniref:Uncharacterized protein n=1 Tax=Lecanosticta acicola TaxID=111012 RepID=A0AAI9EF81_9PEZI|nr:Hypothetical predicted protein [Lecanosticta acicola]